MTDNQITNQPVDPAAPLRAAVRAGWKGLIALAVVGVVLGWIIGRTKGVIGALMGAGLGGGFILITVILVLVTAKLTPSATMIAVMGGWLVKTVAVVAVTVAIKNMDFYHKGMFVGVIIAAIVLVLGSELVALYAANAETPTVDVDESSRNIADVALPSELPVEKENKI